MVPNERISGSGTAWDENNDRCVGNGDASCGAQVVPHTKVGLILVNSLSVGFNTLLRSDLADAEIIASALMENRI